MLLATEPFVARQPLTDEDRELMRRVRIFLASRSALRDLDVKARGGVVTVSGVVPSFHLRQLAQGACRRVAGVRRVIDAIVVDDQ